MKFLKIGTKYYNLALVKEITLDHVNCVTTYRIFFDDKEVLNTESLSKWIITKKRIEKLLEIKESEEEGR